MPPKWSEMFPEGRTLFYEGDDPDGFVREMKDKFSFDPSEGNSGWCAYCGYSFLCPSQLMDSVYGNEDYLLGS